MKRATVFFGRLGSGRRYRRQSAGRLEFRENLAGYLESGKPLAIKPQDGTPGFYIPAQKRSRKAGLEAVRGAAGTLDEMIASRGATEHELMSEYKKIRRAARARKRNSQ